MSSKPPRPSNKNLVVIGAGALGLGLAVVWRPKHETVCVFGREATIARGRLNVSGETVEAEFDPGPAGHSLVVVAVKDYDIDKVADKFKSVLTKASIIIALQNGLGSAERLKDPERVVRAIVWACARRISPAEVSWRGPVRLVVEDRFSTRGFCAAINEQLNDRLINVECVSPAVFRALQFEKLVVNVTSNTLAVLYDMTCAELGENADAIRWANAIADEVATLSAALGSRFREDGKEIVKRAWTSMGDFQPSMLQDMKAGQPLELRSIVDEPLKLADSLDIPMPMLRLLREKLHRYTR